MNHHVCRCLRCARRCDETGASQIAMSTLVKCCARAPSVWRSDQPLTFISNGTRVEDSCAMVMCSAKRSCSASVQVIRCRRHIFQRPQGLARSLQRPSSSLFRQFSTTCADSWKTVERRHGIDKKKLRMRKALIPRKSTHPLDLTPHDQHARLCLRRLLTTPRSHRLPGPPLTFYSAVLCLFLAVVANASYRCLATDTYFFVLRLCSLPLPAVGTMLVR